MGDDFNLTQEYHKKLTEGKRLIDIVDSLNIRGISKLKNKINHEINFLNKTLNLGVLKKEHIQSTNLIHYEAVVRHLLSKEECDSVFESFQLSTPLGTNKKIVVDIVSASNRHWTKVIARNAKALSLISKGEGEFGQRSIVDQAIEYLNAANHNPILYKPPTVEFHFGSGIGSELAESLLQLGVRVTGEIVLDNSLGNYLPNNTWPQHNPIFRREGGCKARHEGRRGERLISDVNKVSSDVVKLNLDVSTMLCYVSNLCNGGSECHFESSLLNHQLSAERNSPVKPILDKLFQDRKLYSCESAVNSFKSIVSLLGGEAEKARAHLLLNRIETVKDGGNTGLKVSGQIKPRSLAIFATGLALHALTVTSNAGFVRAASKQGLHLDVFIHQSRALSEKKEIK